MKANEVALNSFLSQTKTQFIIPVYQRNYDWTQEQCSQLLNDILEVGDKPGETHFIGSIVFIHDGVYTSSDVKQLVVIDGQQRLTTFSLLYLALYKFALKNGLEEKASEIKETFIVNKFVKEDSSKLKLKQSDVNAKAFEFLLSDNDIANYTEYSRLIENFTFFVNNISRENFNIIQTGINSLLFVEISLERGKDDPQRIFESLNSTGLELSQADLIRNYILMGLEPAEQTRVFNNFWSIIENNAKDIEKEESRVSEFIRDYLTFKNKKIPNKSRVYEEFKVRFAQRDAAFYRETLQELKEFSFHYNKLLNPKMEGDTELMKELKFIQRLEINVASPFLMPVYDDYKRSVLSKEDFKVILKLIQSYVWRRFIMGLNPNALNKIFMTLYSDVDKEQYINSIENALIRKKGPQRFPNNAEVELALGEKDVYNIQSKNRVYFLELLENHNNREYVSIENPDITIEHIFPQNPDEKWYEALDEDAMEIMKDKFLNTIANLTLSGNNGSLSNKSFLEKKQMNRDGKQQGYNFSRLWLNQYLKEIDAWNLDTLSFRFKLLVTRFFEIWHYPEVELDEEFDADEEYTIYNAPEPKFKKLRYFIFRDEKVVTDEFSKMYYHILKVLFDQNPSAFYHQDVKTLLGLTTNSADLRSPYPVSSNYFFETNIDSNSKFRRLKTLLTKFDCEEDLLINFSNEPDEMVSESITREYWVTKSNPESLTIVDKCGEILKSIDPNLRINYTSSYIGIGNTTKSQNFILFFPKQGFVRAAVKIKDVEKWIKKLEENGMHFLSINKRNGRMKFRITKESLVAKSQFLTDMFAQSYNEWAD
jgi:uncharacterized protein with ParB-like and HNH nuclease domain